MHSKKDHWESVYQTKQPHEVSWTQEVPGTSLELIESCKLPKTANIIDIGGGDSNLVDHLLERGYENITVLDISSAAIERAKSRLGEKAQKVTWIIKDVTNFEPSEEYDIWHDRAAFHFLTDKEQIDKYLNILSKNVRAYCITGTFSAAGPKKCSGLDIRQYDEEELSELLSNDFEKINCFTEDHHTPFNTIQNFLFCVFRRQTG